jgi:acetyl esterase/lipase
MRFGWVVLGSVVLLAMGLSGVAGAQGHLPAWQPSAGHVQVPIWPGIPPGIPPAVPPAVLRDAGKSGGAEYSELVADKKELVAGRSWVAAEQVSVPTMTVYSPQGVNTGAAVVVFPGGGYEILAMDLEGSEVCDWLVSKGITCVLLKYRVPDSGPAYHEDCQCHIHPKVPAALQDAQRTVGLVRARAAELHIDPTKIGVMGFSAGGHLVANISTHFEKRAYAAVDAADKVSCRPDFAVAVYPGHMTENTKTEFGLNPEIPVRAKTPPTFLVQAEDDNVDGVQQSLVYYIGLKKAGVPVEMHLFAQGGHAFGLRTTKLPITGWPRLVEVWLGTIGVLDRGTRDEGLGTRGRGIRDSVEKGRLPAG